MAAGARNFGECGAIVEADFDGAAGAEWKVSIQTDPRFYRDTEAIVRQAEDSTGSRRI